MASALEINYMLSEILKEIDRLNKEIIELHLFREWVGINEYAWRLRLDFKNILSFDEFEEFRKLYNELKIPYPVKEWGNDPEKRSHYIILGFGRFKEYELNILEPWMKLEDLKYHFSQAVKYYGPDTIFGSAKSWFGQPNRYLLVVYVKRDNKYIPKLLDIFPSYSGPDYWGTICYELPGNRRLW